MTPEIAKILRDSFPPEKIGKLPRITCGDCKDARGRVCDKHAKSRCGECASYITGAHIHLDFVGHADTTDRLLEADREWTWEPFALDPRGLPAMDDNGGMWIRLTVAGVTRIGYGDADGKRGGAAVKETIGDAIRNASMRFGVALDLWRKEVHVDESTGPRQEQRKPNRAYLVAKASDAIGKATTREELESFGLRVAEREKDSDITANDAVILRRQIVAKLDELFPAGEQQITEQAGAAMVTQAQHKRMHVLWRKLDLAGEEHREQRLAHTSSLIDRDIQSSAELTEVEAAYVINQLDVEVRGLPS